MGKSSSLGRFFAAACFLSSTGQPYDPSTCNTPLRLDDLFPCGFAYPMVYSTATPPASSRRRSRWLKQREWQGRVNAALCVNTWLALGRPSERLASVMCLPLSAVQWELVRRMETRMCEFDRLSGADMLGSGGLDSTLAEKLVSLADSRHEYFGAGSDATCEMERTPTVCLDAHNASLPKAAAQIDLVPPVIPAPIARLLESEEGFAKSSEGLPASLPRRHLNISGWPELLRRLVTIGLARLVPLHTIPCIEGRPQLAGLFGVHKADSDLKRMIVDRRPRNACELGAELALARFLGQFPMSAEESEIYSPRLLIRFGTLPHAALFADALWTRSTRVLACVEDAKDFFYLLAMPSSRHCESAFGVPVLARQVSDLMATPVHPDTEVVPVLTSVAMGDQKAMFLAQTAHQHTLWAHDALEVGSWLTWGHCTPGVPLWQGAYCDDYAQLAFVDTGIEQGPNSPTEVLRHAQGAREKVYAAYDAERFVRKQEKSKLDDPEPEIWGARVSSDFRLVCGRPKKMIELAGTTLQLVKNRAATPAQLESLVGTWVHFIMFRRPAMCVLDSCYSWIRTPPLRPRTMRRLSGEVIDELITLVLILPWLCTKLDSTVACKCFLSDATLERGAVVESRLTLAASLALWRRIPRQSGAIRWCDPLQDDDPEDRMDDIRDSFLSALVNSMTCKLVTSFRFSRRARVNVQEAVALRTAVKAACRDPMLWGSRISFLVDSLVVQSTWTRGRSSLHQLNRIQQMALPYVLCAEVVPLFAWIPSGDNPADDPTRNVALRLAAA
eukprot:6471895-Amphidinium_carterae.2